MSGSRNRKQYSKQNLTNSTYMYDFQRVGKEFWYNTNKHFWLCKVCDASKNKERRHQIKEEVFQNRVIFRKVIGIN